MSIEWKPSDTYVARCGRCFSYHYEGWAHERYCEQCQRIAHGELDDEGDGKPDTDEEDDGDEG